MKSVVNYIIMEGNICLSIIKGSSDLVLALMTVSAKKTNEFSG
jgi:hypothetical protein